MLLRATLAALLVVLAGCSARTPVDEDPTTAFAPDRPTVLITGSNRGLGLEFARQYAALEWNVIATCRRPDLAAELRALAQNFPRVAIHTLDVTRGDQLTALAAAYAAQSVDVLLNNAGIYGALDAQSLGSFDYDELKRVLDVNAIGSLRMAEAFAPHVKRSRQKKIVSLGGGMGMPAISRAVRGHYFFKMSKAAHMMAVVSLQADLEADGIIVSMISPGRVDTQMLKDSGWTGKAISAQASAGLVIAMIDRLEPAMGGRLLLYNGTVLPWR